MLTNSGFSTSRKEALKLCSTIIRMRKELSPVKGFICGDNRLEPRRFGEKSLYVGLFRRPSVVTLSVLARCQLKLKLKLKLCRRNLRGQASSSLWCYAWLFSTLFVAARVYSRYLLKTFLLDDWLLTVAWINPQPSLTSVVN